MTNNLLAFIGFDNSQKGCVGGYIFCIWNYYISGTELYLSVLHKLIAKLEKKTLNYYFHKLFELSKG